MLAGLTGDGCLTLTTPKSGHALSSELIWILNRPLRRKELIPSGTCYDTTLYNDQGLRPKVGTLYSLHEGRRLQIYAMKAITFDPFGVIVNLLQIEQAFYANIA